MSRRVLISAALAAIVSGMGLCFLLRPTEERRVKRRLTSLLERVNRKPGEGTALMAVKMHTLVDVFTPNVTFQLRGFFGSGVRPASQLSSEVARARPRFKVIKLSFHDAVVNLPAKDVAVVTVTARLELTTTNDVASSDAREIVITLEKIDGKWLFAKFEELQVLEH